MTTSVLTAALFSMMTYALPTANGAQILQPPKPEQLLSTSEPEIEISGPGSDEDSQSSTLILGQPIV